MSETLMPKVRLGRTDLMVSPICFGTSGLGDMPATFGYSVSVERAAATVNAILDGPTNFIDSARIYGEGRSEERARRRASRARRPALPASCFPPRSIATQTPASSTPPRRAARSRPV